MAISTALILSYTLYISVPPSLPQLTYLSDGQLEEVRVGVKWFEFLLRFGKDRHPSIFTGMPMEYNVVCVQGLNECWAEMLANDLFLPWDSDTKYANRVYFMDQNGLE